MAIQSSGVSLDTSQSEACPICRSPANWAFKSRFVDVAQCSSTECSHLFAMAATNEDGVQTHEDAQAEESLFRERNSRLVEFWKKKGFLRPGVRVLDVGAGAGHISKAIWGLVEGADLTCIEADPASCLALGSLGFQSHRSLLDCSDTFDAILLVEVIEHVSEPAAFLRACRERMATGAKIFLSTPCGQTSRGSRATNAYDTREHVHFFTESSLRAVCNQAGLKVLAWENGSVLYPRRFGLKGWLDRSKSLVRPVRDLLRGRAHLVAFLEREE